MTTRPLTPAEHYAEAERFAQLAAEAPTIEAGLLAIAHALLAQRPRIRGGRRPKSLRQAQAERRVAELSEGGVGGDEFDLEDRVRA